MAGLRDPNGESGLRDPNGESGLRDPNGESGLRDPNGESGLRDPNGETSLRDANDGRGPIPAQFLPDHATIDADGHLSIGGCDLLDVAHEFGTPLFVYDEQHLRDRCREAVAAFPGGVAYATKAFLCVAMARLAHEEGMQLDVATGGEMHVALTAGVPAEKLVLHGNNKSITELAMARTAGVGRIVVDSFHELERLTMLHQDDGFAPEVLLRITPGIEAHTHEFVRTGQEDSKFGFGLHSGAAGRAIELAASSPAVELVGLHMHIGSQVFVADSFHDAVAAMAPFVETHDLPEFCIGGGLGVPYVEGETAPTITEWGTAIQDGCRDAGISATITAEPGRSITAAAAVTLYTAGTIKEIPGVRTYVSVDGGMSDNPRPVLYGSGYETFLPRATNAERPLPVRLVGKHCESGDLLVREGWVPEDIEVDDVLATPVTGAYGHSMGSNYNKILRPAVVFCRDGDARLVVRRESFEDLVRNDVG